MQIKIASFLLLGTMFLSGCATRWAEPTLVSGSVNGTSVALAEVSCNGKTEYVLPQDYNDKVARCAAEAAALATANAPKTQPTSPPQPAAPTPIVAASPVTVAVNLVLEPATGCPPATRLGDADNLILTVPDGWTYTVEAWYPVTGLLVFSEGQTIQGYRGALWGYTCSLDLVLKVEQRKNPVLMVNDQPATPAPAAPTAMPTTAPGSTVPQPTARPAATLVPTVTPTLAPATPAAEICPDAQPLDPADGRVVTVPQGHTFTVESWGKSDNNLNGLLIFEAGQTISGYKGAVWDYQCSAAAVAKKEAAKSPKLIK